MPPDLPAWLYVAATPLLWPAIFLGSRSLTRGGGDSCDRVYADDWSSRDAEFRTAQLVSQWGGGVMIVLGVAVLVSLVARRHRLGPRRWVSCAVVTALATAGYGMLIATSGFTTDCF